MSSRIKLDRSLLQGDRPSLPPPCRMQRQMGPVCSECRGRGYVVGTRGAYADARLCSCVRNCGSCGGRAQRDRPGTNGSISEPCTQPSLNTVVNLVNAALIPARYADASFDDFMSFRGRDRESAQKIAQWRKRFVPRKHKGLVITGPVGVGKTYLLAALTRELAERGISARFTDFFQLLAELRAGFSEGKADATQLAPLIDVEVLVIDELGKGRGREFDRVVIDQLISGRYNQNKTVIASTNYRLEDYHAGFFVNQVFSDPKVATSGEFEEGPEFGFLERRIGRRTFSRLREMTNFVSLDGADYRRQGMP